LRVSLFLPITTDSDEKRLRDFKIPLKTPKIKAVFDKRIKKEYYIHVGTFTSATRRGVPYEYSRILFRNAPENAKTAESDCCDISCFSCRLYLSSTARRLSFVRIECLGGYQSYLKNEGILS
jgi:hypothetical protein